MILYKTIMKGDLGKGLYMTGDSNSQSYIFDENACIDLSVLKFPKHSKEWLEFVLECRNNNDNTDYDLVIGPVVDDKIFNTIELHINGFIDEEETINRLDAIKPNINYVFRSDKALSYIKPYEC